MRNTSNYEMKGSKMEYSKNILRENIKKRREELHLTQGEVADLLGVNPKTYQKYEVDANKSYAIELSVGTLQDLCKHLDCELGYLLGEPGYETGTRTQTDVCRETGLTPEAIAAIKDITSVNERAQKKRPQLLNYWIEPDDPLSFRDLFNKMIVLQSFSGLMNGMMDLVRQSKKTSAEREAADAAWREIEEKYGKEAMNQAIDYCNGKTRLEDLDLSEEMKAACSDVEHAIDLTAQQQFDRDYKYARFTLSEAFSEFINDILETV